MAASLMWSMTIAMPGIDHEDLSSMGLVPDQYVVKDLAPQRPDGALRRTGKGSNIS